MEKKPVGSPGSWTPAQPPSHSSALVPSCSSLSRPSVEVSLVPLSAATSQGSTFGDFLQDSDLHSAYIFPPETPSGASSSQLLLPQASWDNQSPGSWKHLCPLCSLPPRSGGPWPHSGSSPVGADFQGMAMPSHTPQQRPHHTHRFSVQLVPSLPSIYTHRNLAAAMALKSLAREKSDWPFKIQP